MTNGKNNSIMIERGGAMNLRKDDIVREISSETGLSMVEVRTVVNRFMSKIIEGAMSGKRIELRGFGLFTSKKREERVVRNPQTGEHLSVPSCIVPVFKPSKTLRRTIGREATG